MADVLTFRKPIDFLNRNRAFIHGDYFAHYHLIHKIKNLAEKKSELYDSFNIVDNRGADVLVMWVTEGYYIYSNSWTPEIIAKLSEKIDLINIKGLAFCGQRDLIKEFFKFNGVEGEVFKNRCIEVCEGVRSPTKEFVGNIEHASFDDFEELCQMSFDYNQEEFRGRGSQTKETIPASVEFSIEKESMFVWRTHGEIASIAQVIDEHDEYAAIGSLYTKQNLRGNGYGYFLMHSLTAGLLRDGCKKCGLVSDEDNLITNGMFSRIGYKPIYNWVLMRKDT